MRYSRLVVILVMLLPFVAGCWDAHGLDERGFVTMVGIDRKADGTFRVSLQLQLGGPQARGELGAGDGTSSIRVITGDGAALREAVEKARGDVARELDFTFMDTIVIGESAAESLDDLVALARSYRVPATSYMAVARGPAEAVLRARSPETTYPADYTRRGFSGAWTGSAAVVRVYMWMIFNRYYFTPLESPYAPALTDAKYGLNWDGVAVFRGRALAGFLTANQAALFNIASGSRFSHTVAAQVQDQPEVRAALFIHGGKSRRWVTWEQGRPVLHIQVRVGGDLQELTGMHLTTSAEQRRVEAALEKNLAGQVTELMHGLQELGSDPVGFGELARAAAPGRPEVRDGRAWNSAYRSARINVTARVQIYAPGFVK